MCVFHGRLLCYGMLLVQHCCRLNLTYEQGVIQNEKNCEQNLFVHEYGPIERSVATLTTQFERVKLPHF